jgi:hypothetical protein
MRQILAIAFLLVATQYRTVRAWSEGGHHVIALIAFDKLSAEAKAEFNRIIESHPRFAEDFRPPKSMCTRPQYELWRVGRAAYWPDIVRQSKEYDRPTWHYEIGPTLTLGDASKLNIPARPGPLPADSSLITQALYISQAIVLCQRVLNDKTRPDSERALAICWLGHLVADAHQPCYAGSLYIQEIYPDGDRGANRIPTNRDRNMHALWDGLLGKRFGSTINRRVAEISSAPALVALGKSAIDSSEDLNVQTWLAESREVAKAHVYTPAVIAALSVASSSSAESPELFNLSDEYLSNAGHVAKVRAIEAGYRLAEVWKAGL